MEKAKKTIRGRIFLSHIWIVTISVTLTALVFTLCLNLYVRKQTRSQLITAASLVQKTMSAEFINMNLKSESINENRETVKTLLKISRTLKQTQTFLDIDYAVIGKEKSLIFPVNDGSENYNILRSVILPSISKTKWSNAVLKENPILYFTASGKRYVSVLYPLKLESGRNLGHLFLYSDMSKRNKLIYVVNIILVSILLITAIISFIISSIISRKISLPVTQLSKYAKQIGERNYNAQIIKYDDDEIGQLAETMKTMADKLFVYDDTIKTFFQNASHELRTPLMSIQGYAEGIKYGVVENQDNALNIIIEETKRVSRLVEDLLYLSKIDSMHETLNLEEINTEELLRSCIERVNGIALNSGKNVKLLMEKSGVTFSVDEEKLSRAVINILVNGLRYAEKSVEIKLDTDGQMVVISIKDDGKGLEEGEKDKLFDRFYKGKSGNYGLGLTIAKSIIQRHGGSISAENTSEGGACFIIKLPI